MYDPERHPMKREISVIEKDMYENPISVDYKKITVLLIKGFPLGSQENNCSIESCKDIGF